MNNHNNNNNNNNSDHFTKLPDDLFILILTKLRHQDFKFLFRCSLVSKHFACLIPLMPSISISISPTKSSSLKDVVDPSNSSSQDVADRFIDRKMDYLTSLRPQIQNAFGFLKKFDSIRSLDVMFVTDDEDDDNNNNKQKEIFRYGFLPSLINWKTKFDFKLQSFVFLFAQSVSKISDKSDDVIMLHGDVTVTPEELELRLYSSFNGVVDSIEWGNVTSCLLIQHPKLREILISGSRKGGKISLRDQQIVDLKSSLSPEDVSKIAGIGSGIGVTINVKSAFVPVLRLSGTGYVMNSVSLVVVRVGRRLYQPESDGFLSDSDTDSSDEDDGEDVYDENDILNWDFDDDEEVFREAVISILVNHKEKMKRET
ncbi:F-box protein AUF2-like [Bidens hawaiensis]|uniref:F-box protein AUF2-like n=1 Tax=Bidens hawaiensis TaxID=980011 RepID=UPI00404A7AFC